MFGGQSVDLHYCIGALVLYVCILGYTIPLAMGAFGAQSVGLCLCIGALVFVCVYLGMHYTFSFGGVWSSINRLTLLYMGSCSFGVCVCDILYI